VAVESNTTVFGGSAGFFMNCRKAGLQPERGRVWQVGSTGAPLPREGFEWIVDALGDDVIVNSISGGTDVCSAFVGWNPMVPMVLGEISGSMLGREAAAFDETGKRCPIGEQGELVITTPMPSMPLRFLGDADGSRYRKTYFDRFPGVWCHGDWITFTEHGGCVISGRSDATLNRGGVRLGSADFYSVVEHLPEVVDSLVVHLDDGDLDRLYLFVQLRPAAALDDDLRNRIRTSLRTELSPRHVPDVIEAVPSVPRTLSGKKLEVPVKKILSGQIAENVLSTESLADPTAIEWYRRFAANG
jgi:acetoacetyl-CoA synthetase